MKIDYRQFSQQKHQIGLLINYTAMSQISATKLNLSVFSLVRTKKDCYYPPVNADYTPLKSMNQTVQDILPKFNLDRNFYTPAFINPYQQTRLRQNSDQALERQREKFQNKISLCNQSAMDEVPYFSPRDNNYCSLCRITFECYWTHINDVAHIKRIKANKFNTYIYDLCKRFKGKEPEEKENQHQISIESGKRKKISKRTRKAKACKQREVFTKEDFIVKLPSDLFEKEVQHINYNVSTNGFNSLDNLLKL